MQRSKRHTLVSPHIIPNPGPLPTHPLLTRPAGLQYNPAEHICYSCNIKRFNADCAAHGRGTIEWKCRYCCSVASWFCFGSTHMCEGCHSSGVYADR